MVTVQVVNAAHQITHTHRYTLTDSHTRVVRVRTEGTHSDLQSASKHQPIKQTSSE